MKTSKFLAIPALVAFAMLSGCSSVSLNTVHSVPPAPSGSGKYYLNDGPLKGISQASIDAIPEPVPKKEPLNKWAKKPYVVAGNQYVPMTVLAPYHVQGIGSWYGTRYHGSKTSTGEPYDMLKLTAAHPTLPLPSYVRVTNLENNRSIVVRVNDRGPFLHDRIIDLSFAAAARLGYADKGSAMLDVELILP